MKICELLLKDYNMLASSNTQLYQVFNQGCREGKAKGEICPRASLFGGFSKILLRS